MADGTAQYVVFVIHVKRLKAKSSIFIFAHGKINILITSTFALMPNLRICRGNDNNNNDRRINDHFYPLCMHAGY